MDDANIHWCEQMQNVSSKSINFAVSCKSKNGVEVKVVKERTERVSPDELNSSIVYVFNAQAHCTVYTCSAHITSTHFLLVVHNFYKCTFALRMFICTLAGSSLCRKTKLLYSATGSIRQVKKLIYVMCAAYACAIRTSHFTCFALLN